MSLFSRVPAFEFQPRLRSRPRRWCRAPAWCRSHPRCRCSCSRSCCRGCSCSCCRSCCCCRGGRRWRRSTSGLTEDFHRAIRRASVIIAACRPDVIEAVGVSGEVAPRNQHGGAEPPRIGPRIIDIHLINWRRKLPAQHPHLPIEVQSARVARRPRYTGDRCDGIGHWIVFE